MFNLISERRHQIVYDPLHEGVWSIIVIVCIFNDWSCIGKMLWSLIPFLFLEWHLGTYRKNRMYDCISSNDMNWTEVVSSRWDSLLAILISNYIHTNVRVKYVSFYIENSYLERCISFLGYLSDEINLVNLSYVFWLLLCKVRE